MAVGMVAVLLLSLVLRPRSNGLFLVHLAEVSLRALLPGALLLGSHSALCQVLRPGSPTLGLGALMGQLLRFLLVLLLLLSCSKVLFFPSACLSCALDHSQIYCVMRS